MSNCNSSANTQISFPAENDEASREAWCDRVAQVLAQDRPTIDGAVKAFMSLVAARSLAGTGSPQQSLTSNDARELEITDKCVVRDNMEALRCARFLLKSINEYEAPAPTNGNPTNERQHRLILHVWNTVTESGAQKRSRVLGRIALRHVWPGLEAFMMDRVKADDHTLTMFIAEFGTLLLAFPTESHAPPKEDSDAHLVWEANPGAELERRRHRRTQRAQSAQDAQRTVISTIPETPEGTQESN